MGGPHLQAAGMDVVVDCRDLAIIGIVEVLIHWRRIMRELEKLRARLREDRPDLLILVDYPEFNLKLAETAKSLGIPVLFYVSPQVWAWRAHRVKRIGRLVDMMAVLFPFEVDCYQRAGVPVRYVSGYIHTNSEDHLATHAWAEVWLGHNWHTFDVVNLLNVAESHIKLATGLDYLAAAPVRGMRSGGGTERLSTRAWVTLAGENQ
jgi:lipid A disaccharide synthetase